MLVFRTDGKREVIDLVGLCLISLADILERFLIMGFEVIGIKFDTKELPIDLVDGLDILFDIGLVMVFNFNIFIDFFVGILNPEEFSIVVKIVCSLPRVGIISVLLGSVSICSKRVLIFIDDVVNLTDS